MVFKVKLTGQLASDDLNFQHLLAQMNRIDLLIRRQVLRWQKAGQDPQDAFRGLYISDGEAQALLDRPLGANWGQVVELEQDLEKSFSSELEKSEHVIEEISKAAHGRGRKLRLEVLADVFALDPWAVDMFLICAAPYLDLRYERLYGYLQDDVTRKRPSVNLVLDLLGMSGPAKLKALLSLSQDMPLFRHNLIEKVNDPSSKQSLLSQALTIDESVFSWLLGKYQPRSDVNEFITLQHPRTDGLAQTIDLDDLAQIGQQNGKRPILVFYGIDQVSQEAVTHRIANHFGEDILVVNLETLSHEEPEELRRVLQIALRDALLLQSVLWIKGWDACLSDGVAPVEILAAVCAYEGLIIISGRAEWRAAGVERERNLVWREFPIPAYPQRRFLWHHYLSQVGVEIAENLDINSLSGQFQLTSGQIRDAVAFARDWVVENSKQLDNITLFSAARLYSNPRLSSLAHKILPRYLWEDIVLPADQVKLLHEIVDTVRGRPIVLDEWGIGKKLASSRGVTILFAGPPGTGKTMAAEVIASELGLDLYKIDLSTVVSKYIGETEKNLERIFNEAEASNAILFFDEADSLFGKRSEVRDSHDRYANIEISYLLQRMEAYDGVTILATNLRANLDEAFTRRLQFAVDFPFPEEADRLRIWTTLFPADVPREEQVDFKLLSRRFKLAGGNIRNIIVSAAYLAASDGGVVKMTHLMHGTRRELQKMGRLIGEEDLYQE